MKPTKFEGDCKRIALARVPFYGETLDAVKTADGKVWVSLRRCCENLGLAMEVQLRKLKGKAWACMTEMVMQIPGDAQSRSYAMIDLETLPGWLFSIDARKVSEHTREKLAKYQREAARVLAEHFIYGKANANAVSREEHDALVKRCASLLDMIEWARPELPDPQKITATLDDRLKAAVWANMRPEWRDYVTRLANVLIEMRTRQQPEHRRGGYLYRGSRQIAILDEAIESLRDELKGRRGKWAERVGV